MVPRSEFTREGLRALRRSFQRLLHRKYFRLLIRGGLYVIEAKYGDKGWNIHIHALMGERSRTT